MLLSKKITKSHKKDSNGKLVNKKIYKNKNGKKVIRFVISGQYSHSSFFDEDDLVSEERRSMRMPRRVKSHKNSTNS